MEEGADFYGVSVFSGQIIWTIGNTEQRFGEQVRCKT